MPTPAQYRKQIRELKAQCQRNIDGRSDALRQLEEMQASKEELYAERNKARDAKNIAEDQSRRANVSHKLMLDELACVRGQRDQLAGYIEGHRAFQNPARMDDGRVIETWLDDFLRKCTLDQPYYHDGCDDHNLVMKRDPRRY